MVKWNKSITRNLLLKDLRQKTWSILDTPLDLKEHKLAMNSGWMFHITFSTLHKRESFFHKTFLIIEYPYPRRERISRSLPRLIAHHDPAQPSPLPPRPTFDPWLTPSQTLHWHASWLSSRHSPNAPDLWRASLEYKPLESEWPPSFLIYWQKNHHRLIPQTLLDGSESEGRGEGVELLGFWGTGMR